MGLPVLAALIEGVLSAECINTGTQSGNIRVRQQHRSDNVSYLGEALSIKAAGCQRGGTDTQTGGHHRRARVVRHSVTVNGNTGIMQQIFCFLAIEGMVAQVNEHQGNVGTAGGDRTACGLPVLL